MIAPQRASVRLLGRLDPRLPFATAGEAVKVRDRLLKADFSVAVGEMSRQVESG
jgi:hypothetical protein